MAEPIEIWDEDSGWPKEGTMHGVQNSRSPQKGALLGTTVIVSCATTNERAIHRQKALAFCNIR